MLRLGSKTINILLLFLKTVMAGSVPLLFNINLKISLSVFKKFLLGFD